MSARHTVVALLLLALLFTGLTPYNIAAQSKDATAAELLNAGLEQFANGQYGQAKATLQRVDAVQLDKEQRDHLREALRRIAAEQPPAPVALPATTKAETPEAPATPQAAPQTTATDQAQQPVAPPPTLQQPAASDATTNESRFARARTIRAQQLVAEADAAATRGDYNTAQRLYDQALLINEGNAAALRGRDNLRALMGRDPGSRLLDQPSPVIKLRQEQAQARYDESMRLAGEMRNQGNFTQSRDAASLAKAILDNNRQYLEQSDYEQRKQVVSKFLAEIDVQAEQQQARNSAIEAAKAKETQESQRMKAEQAAERKIQELLRRAADLRKELNYEQSLEVLNQVLFLDPNNIPAQAMKEMIEDTIVDRNTRDLVRRRSLLIAEHSVENMAATVPHTDLLMYPPDWPQLSQLRDNTNRNAQGDSELNRRAAERLKQLVPVDLEDATFENAIAYLKETSTVDFFVNWKALEAAGVERTAPVNIKLSNVSAEKALRLVLDQVGGDFVPLNYAIEDGIVVISTSENLAKNTKINTYDIRDLIVQVPNFTAPEFDLSQATQSQQAGGQSGGGGNQQQSLFSDDQDQQDEDLLTRSELTSRITTLIRSTVDPDGWRDNGGLVSSMQELNGTLIVNSTDRNHKQIQSLLDQLRESRALAINIEARFLLVDQNYLDEVGVDLDFTINNLGSNISPIVVNQDSVTLAGRPSSGVPGSFGSASATGTGTGTGSGSSATSRGLSISGGYLNDLQVNLLINATQAHRRAITLTAPRLTLFNGQRANVTIATERRYVSALNPVTGTNAVAFNPTLSSVFSGTTLDLEATVSADRKYVTITAEPRLNRLATIRQISFSAINNVTDTGGTGGTGGTPSSQISTGTLEAPEVEITQISTTVNVPDKGTLLLGGQRLVSEIEVEAGVPVLSKIPFLNRLTTNRSMIKDERTLLILIKPTIIIQSEKEEQLFPGIRTSPELFPSSARQP